MDEYEYHVTDIDIDTSFDDDGFPIGRIRVEYEAVSKNPAYTGFSGTLEKRFLADAEDLTSDNFDVKALAEEIHSAIQQGADTIYTKTKMRHRLLKFQSDIGPLLWRQSFNYEPKVRDKRLPLSGSTRPIGFQSSITEQPENVRGSEKND